MSFVARVVLLIALALLPGLSVQLYTEYRLRETREQEVLDTALRLGTQAGATFGRLADGARLLLATLALVPAVQGSDEATCNQLLADLHQQFPDYDRIGVVDTTGRRRCASDTAARDDANLPYFRRAVATRDFASALRAVPGGVADTLQFGYPLYTAGEFSGLVFAEMSLRRLANLLRHSQPLPPGATLQLIDQTGTTLLRLPDDPAFVGTRIAAGDLARMSARPVGAFSGRGADGRERIFGHVPMQLVGDERVLLSVGLDYEAAFAEYRNASRSALLLIAIGSCVALIIAGAAARWFLVRPIRRLMAAAERWGHGDYTYRLALQESRSELGRLGFSLNQMAGTCQDLLRRKDLLFKEINHRIFNSLQVLSSAISLQRGRLATQEAREHSDRIRQRVMSTGLILRRIYAADQMEEVQFDRFLHHLSNDLARVLVPPHMKDRLRIAAVSTVVPIDWIVPLASVVVELVLSIARRLRADSDRRLIDVSLEANTDMSLRLAVSGSGDFAEEVHAEDGSLRSEIVRLLMDQLGGTLETQRGADWIRFTLHLPRPPRPASRPDL
jgi:two-component sensor histidine kinase